MRERSARTQASPVSAKTRWRSSLPAAPRRHEVNRERTQVERLHHEVHLPHRDAADVEQVLDQPRHVPGLPLDDRLHLGRIARARAAQLHDVRGGRQRSERVAQLVAQHRDELGLRAVGRLERVYGAAQALREVVQLRHAMDARNAHRLALPDRRGGARHRFDRREQAAASEHAAEREGQEQRAPEPGRDERGRSPGQGVRRRGRHLHDERPAADREPVREHAPGRALGILERAPPLLGGADGRAYARRDLRARLRRAVSLRSAGDQPALAVDHIAVPAQRQLPRGHRLGNRLGPNHAGEDVADLVVAQDRHAHGDIPRLGRGAEADVVDHGPARAGDDFQAIVHARDRVQLLALRALQIHHLLPGGLRKVDVRPVRLRAQDALRDGAESAEIRGIDLERGAQRGERGDRSLHGRVDGRARRERALPHALVERLVRLPDEERCNDHAEDCQRHDGRGNKPSEERTQAHPRLAATVMPMGAWGT
jgi:hypothetical protein